MPMSQDVRKVETERTEGRRAKKQNKYGARQLGTDVRRDRSRIRPISDGTSASRTGRNQSISGRGGSVKIKSHYDSSKIKWTLRSSFSAVSTPIFASKHSLESSWRDLEDLHAFAPLRPQYFSKISSFFFGVFKVRNAKQFAFFKSRRDFRWFLIKITRILSE